MISAIIIVQLLFGLTCFSAQPTPSAESPLQLSSKNTTKTSLYYDQRQTGKYNINVNIKDVAIISLEPENLSSNIGVSSLNNFVRNILNHLANLLNKYLTWELNI